MKHRVAAALCLCLLVPSVAAADDVADPFADDEDPFADEDLPPPPPARTEAPVPRHRIAGVLGVGTPVGNAGVEFARALHRYVDAAAGAGLSLSEGPQLALMLRPQYRYRDVTASIGGGASVGFAPSPLFRLNLEGGVQYTHESAWSARVFAGYSFLTAGDDGDGTGEPMCTYDYETYEEHCTYPSEAGSGPYVGVSAGKSF